MTGRGNTFGWIKKAENKLLSSIMWQPVTRTGADNMPYSHHLYLWTLLGFWLVVFYPAFGSISKVYYDHRNSDVKAYALLTWSAANPWITFKNQYHLEMLIVLSGLLQQCTGCPKHPVNLADEDGSSARQSSWFFSLKLDSEHKKFICHFMR